MFQNTRDYTKTWDTFAGYDFLGNPQFTTETQHLLIGKFDEYFIHYLSEQLAQLQINPNDDCLERAEQFKDLYINCRLDCQHEYEKNSSLPP
jgi:hypothetical protein